MPLIACVDVDYRGSSAVAAALTIDRWDAPTALAEITVPIAKVEPYVPGQFFRRELPCILAVLQALKNLPEIVVIDGYVWLAPGKPGLGAHLFTALGNPTIIVGVAKTRFPSAVSVEVKRGTSQVPLFITAEGMDPAIAAGHIQSMHGPYRLPTLLKRVDQLCRQAGQMP